MIPKVCIVISECPACSNLTSEQLEKIESILKSDKKIFSIIKIKPLCSKEGLRELKNTSPGECDRLVIAAWCDPESVEILRNLPKPIPISLVEISNLLLISSKKPGEKSSIDPIVRAIRSSVARISLAEPLKDRRRKFATKCVAVIGSDDRAIKAAKVLASFGIDTKLLLAQSYSASDSPSNLEIIDNANPKNLSGFSGNFKITVSINDGEQTIESAAVLLVSELCSEQIQLPSKTNFKFVPLEQFDDLSGNISKAKGIVFIDDLQVIAPTSNQAIPSWHLLLESAKTAALSKIADTISVVARDIKSTGLLELLWKEAAEAGVKFVRYDDKSKPKMEKDEPIVSVKDLVLGEKISLPADIVICQTISRPWEPLFIERLSIPADWNLRSKYRGPQRGTGQSVCDGIFLLGYANYDSPSEKSELSSVVLQILSFVNQGYQLTKASIAEVDEEKCSACLTCVRTCSYRAAIMNDQWKAEIIIEKCAGCGNCVSVCPSRAIELKNCTRPQIYSQLFASLEEVSM